MIFKAGDKLRDFVTVDREELNHTGFFICNITHLLFTDGRIRVSCIVRLQTLFFHVVTGYVNW
jgi:hypothetical protein